MKTLTDLVAQFDAAERSAGNLLDIAGLEAQAIAATRMYAGYARLISLLPTDQTPVPQITLEITGATLVTVSEWAVIRPLFLLYVERESAIQLEASRGMGLDVFGRSTDSIAGDITVMESELPRRAFYFGITSV